ncbi:SDR family NAD(P)-dependent oxidoreductase, partial [Pseudomonas aeruginosa]|uniref:SDR family NAD(P)-dependent oxidoreductase n=1 Tax=Pseudomonas aeruginosa TaxID=287 RepID=UPI001C60AE22
MRIYDRVLLVTGGSSVIGADIANMLVEHAGTLMLSDIVVYAVAAQAAVLVAQARFVRADIASEADGHTAVAAALAAFTDIHGMATCASVASAATCLRRNVIHALASYRRVIDIKLLVSVNMLRLASAAV